MFVWESFNRGICLQGTSTHCVYESVPFLIAQNPYQKYYAGGLNGAFVPGSRPAKRDEDEESQGDKWYGWAAIPNIYSSNKQNVYWALYFKQGWK